MQIDDLETPCIVVDFDRLQSNINRLQVYLSKHGIANRPHIKTHKIPEIAHMQIQAGAVGITCQKLGEAEVMADAGVKDIFLPYNIIGPTKLDRLAQLARRIHISLTADSDYVVQGLSQCAQHAGLSLEVLVECDTGGKRCGAQTPQAAADLAQTIQRSPGLHFGGLMTFPNTDQTAPFMDLTVELLRRQSIPVERISGGGTPGMWQAHMMGMLTEHRAGTYVYGDRNTIISGAMSLDDCSFSVLSTVVSKPTSERVILDGGSKTFSSDLTSQDGYGLLPAYPEAILYRLTEEHGLVDVSNCEYPPKIGDRLRVIPNHCCVVTNLFDRVAVVRNDHVELFWSVAARGRLQ